MFVFKSFVNSYHYLYQDAEYFQQLATRPEISSSFEAVRLSRTALLLYILSLEALINRAWDHFLPANVHDFFLEREDRYSLEDKWLLLPMLVGNGQDQFDRSRYPWSHFAEMIRIRNEYVHSKHDRPAYYEAVTQKKFRPFPWNAIPDDLPLRETDLIYRQTRVPKDPYSVKAEHVETIRSIVDAMVIELDRLLGGRILKDNWYRNDAMELVYPPGATLNDLPLDGSD